jgi:peptidoglycan/LPS O-acetylase OafA/YrhL
LRRFGKYSYAIYLFHFPLHLLASQRVLSPLLMVAGRPTYLVVQGAYLAVGPFVLLGFGAVFSRGHRSAHPQAQALLPGAASGSASVTSFGRSI